MKIILHNGTEIKNLTLNASTLVSETEPDRNLFTGNLETVKFCYDDGTEETKKNMSLDTMANYGDGWYICLSENPGQAGQETDVPEEILDKAEAFDILMGGA